MSALARFRQADLNRAVKVATAHGLVVEVRGDVLRLVPLTTATEAPSPTDPLDAELAQWAAKRGYD